MAKVALRAYNREIEGLIEHGGLDEAIAHCHHILKTFPKHIETYRLLGKAYLEAKRYNEAVDIFQRVLASVPEDFVSHVGMSIIDDEQNKLNEAIWHMERAFEVQPSNAAIQAELQRLFGRRDGVEPPKIRLTRGALAHMYMQGELYNQAISEIRAVLSNDNQRMDMQILLAKAYFKNGQKADATDICNQLLKRLQYCLDANRILVDIMPASGPSSESTLVYKHRVSELDPYAAFAKESVFHTEGVPDAAVSLEHLEYTGQPVESNIDWASKISSGLTADSAASAAAPVQPDWLKSAAPAAQSAPAAPPAPAEEIPDFMRQAGWTESSGLVDESQIGQQGEAEAGSSAVQGDLPDWVKAMAPTDENQPAAPGAVPASDTTPDWLRSLGGETAPASPAEPEETPSWLKSLSSSEIPEPSPSVRPQPAAQPQGEADWLRNLGGSQPIEETPAEEVPDWLNTLDQSQAAPSKAKPAATGQSPQAAAPSPSAAQPAVSPAAGLGDLGTSAKEQDDAMAWLESLAAKHGAKPEELVTDPNARSEVAPEWVDKAKEIGEQIPLPPQPAAPAEDETGLWLKNLQAQEELPAFEEPQPEPAQPDLSDWRSSLGGQEPFEGPVSKFSQEAAQPAEEIPEWLKEPGNQLEESKPTTASLPDWLAGLDQEEGTQAAQPAKASTGDLPNWLQAEAEPQVTEPARSTDWQRVEPKPVVEGPAAQEPEPVAERPTTPIKAAAKVEKKAPVQVERPRPAVSVPKAGEASLAAAQNELGRGNIAVALEMYSKLIRKGKSLEDIIRDLRDALYRYPVEVPIWQALGDAYMRANRLQEALDAYTKAEELLR